MRFASALVHWIFGFMGKSIAVRTDSGTLAFQTEADAAASAAYQVAAVISCPKQPAIVAHLGTICKPAITRNVTGIASSGAFAITAGRRGVVFQRRQAGVRG